jgi:predicted glutamine amidotransferase
MFYSVDDGIAGEWVVGADLEANRHGILESLRRLFLLVAEENDEKSQDNPDEIRTKNTIQIYTLTADLVFCFRLYPETQLCCLSKR